jgi:hypothetical protein
MLDVVLALLVLGLLMAALPLRSYRFEHSWDKRAAYRTSVLSRPAGSRFYNSWTLMFTRAPDSSLFP